MTQKRKLIEVALPLEVINRESAREKSIRHGHPSTLHLWWARRPLAAARAVLFAQLVDDPSSLPDKFPTEESQKAERERLHNIIERLVVWENIRDERLLEEARNEILKSTGGSPPPILDPFAGGGTIPLEAQRLGLETRASDLNPVAVLINKALIEFPPMFRDRPPVFPGLAESETTPWTGARGLAADVRAYGQWMRDTAVERIGHLYPKADGRTVIAWIWARTVTCPNPACGIEMPLVRSWWLGTKKGKEAYIVPSVVADPSHPSGKQVAFAINHNKTSAPTADADGTVGRNGAVCIACQTAVELAYIRAEGRAGRIGNRLLATVAEGDRQRVYLAPDSRVEDVATVARPAELPDGQLPEQALGFRVQAYGMTEWADLFTNRQLVALTTFSDIVGEARERILADALATGLPEGDRLAEGGTGAAGYADVLAVYLGLGVSKAADMNNTIVRWKPSMDQSIALFSRQAIPMMWDFAETHPLSDRHAGGVMTSLIGMARVLDSLVPGAPATVRQVDAASVDFAGALVSTDPPYYDNIGYSDLSDFFYTWQRRTLRNILPGVFGTLLVPKTEELVANPYRHGGRNGAKAFFEHGFREVFRHARETAATEYPTTVYYAFKQSESDADGESSSGWESLLDGMVHNGWQITATWPIRSELSNRMVGSGTNALASSIVLALRPRPESAPSTDRPGFIAALKAELGDALERLQAGGIAPVDLPQAAIGPGMAVFSRYTAVREFDGTRMTVRSALARINEVLDEVLSEQEEAFDSTTRFCLTWYRQHGYSEGKFGDADNVARARNTAVDTMDRDEVLSSRAGKVRLFRPSDLSDQYDVIADDHTSAWEGLHHLIRVLESDGVAAAGAFLNQAISREDRAVDPELLTELAHLLFRISEDNKWTKEAISFNNVVTAWADIVEAQKQAANSVSGPTQSVLDLEY